MPRPIHGEQTREVCGQEKKSLWWVLSFSRKVSSHSSHIFNSSGKHARPTFMNREIQKSETLLAKFTFR